jgi:hypothetical protein
LLRKVIKLKIKGFVELKVVCGHVRRWWQTYKKVMAVAQELSKEVEKREVFSRVCKESKVQADILRADNSRFRCRKG